MSPLYIAAQRGFELIVELLLEFDAWINWREPSSSAFPLYVAANRGREKAVQVLVSNPEIDLDMTMDADGATALIIAAANGHADVCAALVQAGADVTCRLTTDGTTALECAVEAGHTQLAEWFHIQTMN